MNDLSPFPAATGETRPPEGSTTPAGIQSTAELRRRRLIVLGLNVSTWFVLNAAAWSILGSGGWTIVDIVLALAFAIATPWTVLGFWNALIGLWLLHGEKDAMEEVAPFARAGDLPTPLGIRTAVFMTLRNEDPERAIARLKIVKASIDATGEGAQFDYFILSDTNRDEIGEREAVAAAAFAAEAGEGRVVYRRRTVNTGFKAGNVRDFLERWGARYELMLPLDADSLMSGATIVKHVRMMQAYPRLGILQSLVVGMPSSSAFARIFQFGMRQGMRSYTMGQAWWVAIAGRSGATTPSSASVPSWTSATCRCSPANRRLAVTSSPMTRSRRPSCAAPATRCACCPSRRAPGRRIRRPSSNSRAATCAGARATCST